MTSIATNPDSLVLIDGATGVGTLIGDTGVKDIWGLTFAWNNLFGFTKTGDLVEIDPTTGSGTIQHTFTGKSFFGAASSPLR